MDRHEQYVIKIIGALEEVFKKDSEHFISELKDVDLTSFFTAASAALGMMFNQYTGEQKNAIDFTHVLNGLAVRRVLEIATKEGAE
ncbi:hypothetical protein [Bacillus sp. Bos-x628]|uniref:hypothetical protein n=1 Tax=Bacillus maqinnsis TaxID=3229854 RepID=UPI0033901949